MIRFLAALNTPYYQILRVPPRTEEKIKGVDFRGTVWFWRETEISLNCYNSRNICHCKWFSVIIVPQYDILTFYYT